ncbi:DEAD/DEAH box helicase [Kiloniella laminariae]|uniref:DEAD/DEAH box helicase n=1 Tax=Kiloniella laminariae TaxID=454162 RepID=A0ABT4LLH8_9PROT|nr:DEAD/DEAH box helicase [Kiloniella laminariae]MCZ4281958.1 DEAD/DEAH box helicase [Kiloniella laminariae]
MSFSDLGLNPKLLQAIEEVGYTTPTPIQEQAIPYVLMGRDVLGCAQTGTGKTASFTLPMIEMLSSGRARARMPRSLILTPTRELAAQISENFENYGKHSKLTKALLIGGSSFADQIKLLERGVDVLIATPGRLLDLFERGKIMLVDTKLLVIDEADRMLDMGFIPDVEKIVSLLPPLRQTLFFSATMAPEIKKLSDKFLSNPKEISVSKPASTAVTVEQKIIKINGDSKDKRDALRKLMRDEGDILSGILFCNRKKDVDILNKSLNVHGFSASALHGDMAQSSRTETLELFRDGKVKLLVCSDVAARGLDIPAVSHVFNFDVPINAEDYVHRIGRTGRAGRAGKAFTLAMMEDYKSLRNVLNMIGSDIPVEGLEGFESWTDEEAEANKGRRRKRPTRSDSAKPSNRERPARRPARASSEKPAAEPEKAEIALVETTGTERPERKSSAAGDRRTPAASRRRTKPSAAIGEREPSSEPSNPTSSFGDHTPAFILREAKVA